MGYSINTVSELTAKVLPALGGKAVFEIPRSADLNNIHIQFSGSVTLSTGATSIITDGILNAITAVELTCNSGRDVIASVPFAPLIQGNMWRRKRGHAPYISQVGVAIAANAFDVSGWLDLSSFGAIRPKESALREGNYDSIELAFRFAPDFTGVFTGGGFVVSASSLNLTCSIEETIELPDENGQYSMPVARPQIVSSQVIQSAAANKQSIKLNAGQGLRGIVLRVSTNATPPVLSDSLLTRIRCNVGKVTRLDIAGATLKSRMKAKFPATPPVGYYFIDFSELGTPGSADLLNNVLDLDPKTTNGADSLLEWDNSAACIIDVVQVGLIPLAK